MRKESVSQVDQLSPAFICFSGGLADTQIIKLHSLRFTNENCRNKTALAVPSQQTYAVRVRTFASANLPRKMIASSHCQSQQCASSRNKMASNNSGSGENRIGLIFFWTYFRLSFSEGRVLLMRSNDKEWSI